MFKKMRINKLRKEIERSYISEMEELKDKYTSGQISLTEYTLGKFKVRCKLDDRLAKLGAV